MELLKTLNVADLMVDTRMIDIGKPAFRPYLLDGWGSDRKEKDGTTSAMAIKRVANAIFYCHTPKDKVLTVRCRIEPGFADAQSFHVLVNSRKIRGKAIRPDYKEYFIPVPGNYFVPGKNQIRFVPNVIYGKSSSLRPGISFDYFAFLEKEEADKQQRVSVATARANEIYFSEINERKPRTVLVAPTRSAIAFYEKLPPDAHLALEYGFLSEDSTASATAEFLGFIETENGVKEKLFTETISRGYFVSPQESKTIYLKKYANQIVRIVIASKTVSDKPAPSHIYWGKVALQTPKASVSAKPEAPRASEKRPNVFLYLIDALRADHLQSYAYPKSTSPRIKEFAADSVLFENAYAQSAWTRASLATIMTGLYPSSHLTERRMETLPPFIPTIASELKANGYQTRGFTTNGNVSAAFGFQKGYDEYVHLREQPRTKEIHVQSNVLFQSVNGFLNRPFPVPTYLYVHATDPHEPYTPAPFEVKVPPDCPADQLRLIRPRALRHRSPYNEKDLECMIALYDSEILKADFYFGKFLDILKQKNLYKDSLIILTADHGEEFLEHGMLKHGVSLYQAEIQIPLIIHFPRGENAGKRIKSYARHMDILPTILEVISARGLPGVQGSSLLPYTQGKSFEGPVFGELVLDANLSKYLILDSFKLIEQKRGRGMVQSLFNIVDDPLEKTDLMERNTVRFGYMRKLMKEWSESQQKRNALLKKPREAVLDKETAEALKALGYLQ